MSDLGVDAGKWVEMFAYRINETQFAVAGAMIELYGPPDGAWSDHLSCEAVRHMLRQEPS